jgi:hypothetical protein
LAPEVEAGGSPRPVVVAGEECFFGGVRVLSIFPAGRGGKGESLGRVRSLLRRGCRCTWSCCAFVMLLLTVMVVVAGAGAGVSATSGPAQRELFSGGSFRVMPDP